VNAISESRLREILARFDSLSLVVVGDCMLDRYIWGVVERISPEAPVPVVHVSRESVRLGGAANVAANLRALGARVNLLGVTGDDDAGRAFARALNERGLDAAGIIADSSRPTTVKERVIAQSQQVVRIDRENRAAAPPAVVAKLCALAEPLVRASDGVIVSDYAKGLLSGGLAARIIAMSRDAGRFVAVDPKAPSFDCYAGASLVTPNQGEAAQAAGFPIRDDESLVRAGESILRGVGAQAVLVTRGEHGMSLFERGGGVLHLPTVAREVFDVTGAGDTVISTFMMAVAAGATLAEAAILSNHAAGAVIREVGAATLSRDDLAAAALGRESA